MDNITTPGRYENGGMVRNYSVGVLDTPSG